MTKRMLIDATHPEETRVVVLDGNRLEDFDVETASRRQLKGNIYLAKVVRVEPSLQAAFVEYGGNRHGFLAFGEIHPDYYQIPVADRQRLLALQEEEARAAEQEEDEADEALVSPGEAGEAGLAPNEAALRADQVTVYAEQAADFEPAPASVDWFDANAAKQDHVSGGGFLAPPSESDRVTDLGPDSAPEGAEQAVAAAEITGHEADSAPHEQGQEFPPPDGTPDHSVQDVGDGSVAAPQTVGGSDQADDTRGPRTQSRYLRNYKIQEVIRRRQILLIQVVKEERGTKGAALTTYISLAGRFSVLMPNSPRGGGISRKITSVADRRRLKEVTAELEIPRGMGLIVRTAGAARPKPEIKRDGEYLLRLWDEIRDLTMQSVAPALIYEEASLIKRAIRDVYSRDVDEILVDGEEGWKAARDFMRMLMPTHVKKVQLWRDGGAPLFARQQVEAQLDAMLVPTVQLRSGGYLVIDQTEALVAIDVNSGRSTRERGIEETALRTNLEAADEVARQLRLRDLAGLIVIDFIDMESKKHNAAVERRMKEALRDDRARIQLGSISHFGLLEMSRQRLRPSVAETSQSACPHCGGTGHVRSTDSAALHVLRAIEDEGSKRRAAEIMVHVAGTVAMFILNHKRVRLMEIEQRTGMKVCFSPDDALLPGQTRIDKLRSFSAQELPPAVSQTQARMDASEAQSAGSAEMTDEEEPQDDEIQEAAAEEQPRVTGPTAGREDMSEEGQTRRRKRRRRRGGRREDGATVGVAPMQPGAEQPELSELAIPEVQAASSSGETVATDDDVAVAPDPEAGGGMQSEALGFVPGRDEAAEAADEHATPKPRVRRGGRRRAKTDGAGDNAAALPRYAGPTPADPFANVADIFDILEQAEQRITPSAPQPSEDSQMPAVADIPELAPALALSEAVAPVDPVDVAASAEPMAESGVQPVVIGAGESSVAEPKRGWWRR